MKVKVALVLPLLVLLFVGVPVLANVLFAPVNVRDSLSIEAHGYQQLFLVVLAILYFPAAACTWFFLALGDVIRHSISDPRPR